MAQWAFLIGIFVVAVVLAITHRLWMSGAGHGIAATWRIAKITIAEARRRRVVQAVVVLVLVILLSMTFFRYLNPREQSRMLISSGLSAITVFGILLSIFVAAFLIPQELESRTIYAVLSKPVRRFEFVLGKYLGALIILAVIMTIMLVVLVAVLLAQDYLVPDLAHSSFETNLQDVIFAGVMSYFAVALLAAYIVLISTVSSTAMTVIASFIIWVIGSLQSKIHDLAMEADTVLSKWFFTLFYWLVPPLENFDFRHEVSNFMQVSYQAGIKAAGQGILYIIVVLLVASIFFSDRQV
jgi:ABC-type transport system involved in multi-copper enzyme maturation permease subunit